MGREDEVGARLQQLRKAHSLTQKQFAERAGVSQALISQIESGVKALPTDALWKLIDEFGPEAESIITTGTREEYGSNLIEAWRLYREVERALTGLLSSLIEHAEVLRPFQRDLESRLPRVTEIKHLDALISASAIDGFKRYFVPLAETVPEFQRMPKGVKLDKKTARLWAILLKKCVRLSEPDLQLLIKVATRFGRPMRHPVGAKEFRAEGIK